MPEPVSPGSVSTRAQRRAENAIVWGLPTIMFLRELESLGHGTLLDE